MVHPDQIVARHAEARHGVVGRAELRLAGLSDRQIEHRVETNRLIPACPGVYRVPGAPQTWHQRLAIAVTLGGPGAAVSHRAAAVLRGLSRLDAIVEVSTPRRRRMRAVPFDAVIHTSIVLPRSDITRVAELPCTTVERTLIDLGAVVPERRVAHALDTALRDGLTDLGVLRYVHARRRGKGRRGAGVLARILDVHGVGRSESPYERDLVTTILDSALPLPIMQYEIRDRRGLVGRTDLAWPRYQVAVEVDGHGYHATRAERANDSVRQNRLTEMGWKVLRFTTDQVAGDRHGVVRQIASVIRSCDV